MWRRVASSSLSRQTSSNMEKEHTSDSESSLAILSISSAGPRLHRCVHPLCGAFERAHLAPGQSALERAIEHVVPVHSRSGAALGRLVPLLRGFSGSKQAGARCTPAKCLKTGRLDQLEPEFLPSPLCLLLRRTTRQGRGKGKPCSCERSSTMCSLDVANIPRSTDSCISSKLTFPGVASTKWDSRPALLAEEKYYEHGIGSHKRFNADCYTI